MLHLVSKKNRKVFLVFISRRMHMLYEQIKRYLSAQQYLAAN